VSLSGASLELALGSGVTADAMRAAGPQSFLIIDAANGQLNGTFNTLNFTSPGFLSSEWSVAYSPTAGNATLNFTPAFVPVPEPCMVLGFSAVALFAGLAVRRRRAARSLATVTLQVSTSHPRNS